MEWKIAVAGVAIVFIAAALAAIGRKPAPGEEEHQIESYLLAGGMLGRLSVVNLLLSSSFALNSLFYAIWLGYQMGIWALIVQLAWSLSFVLLRRHVTEIRAHRSLHEFLGSRFGPWTRATAATCSLLGMMYLMGWETAIGTETFRGLLENGSLSADRVPAAAGFLSAMVVIGCLFYTVLGGLRGNAFADLMENAIKLLGLSLLLIGVVIGTRATQSAFGGTSGLFMPFRTAIGNIGVLGLLTNVAFNIAWQFVDTSSWQSLIAGHRADPEDTRFNLGASALAIFVVPGILGTVLGAQLIGTPNVDGSNILVRASQIAIVSLGPIAALILSATFAAAIMSLVDGLFLASACTLVIDWKFRDERLADLDADIERSERILTSVRIALLLIAAVAIWGVTATLRWLGVSLFDFVYVVIILQLALAGPVLVAFRSAVGLYRPMWIAIVAAVVLGFACVLVGNRFFQPLADASGIVTLTVSWLIARAMCRASEAVKPVAAT